MVQTNLIKRNLFIFTRKSVKSKTVSLTYTVRTNINEVDAFLGELATKRLPKIKRY